MHEWRNGKMQALLFLPQEAQACDARLLEVTVEEARPN